MIPARELRPNNLIMSIFDKVETVRMILGHEGYRDRADIHEIYKHLIGVEENRNQYNLAEIKPILFTDEWKLKLGFNLKQNNGGYRIYGFGPFEIDSENTVSYKSPVREFKGIAHIPHIHQFQNLYAALLIGKEFPVPPVVFRGSPNPQLYYIRTGEQGNICTWRKDEKEDTTEIMLASRYTYEHLLEIFQKMTHVTCSAWPCEYIDEHFKAKKLVIDKNLLSTDFMWSENKK